MIGALFVFAAVAISVACGSPCGELLSNECSGNSADLINSFINGGIISGELLGSEFASTSSNGLIQLASLGGSSDNESVVVLESPVAAPILESINTSGIGSAVIPMEFVSSPSVGVSAAAPISTLSSVASFVGQECETLGVSDLGTSSFSPSFSASPAAFPGIFPFEIPSSKICPPVVSCPLPVACSSEVSFPDVSPSVVNFELPFPKKNSAGITYDIYSPTICPGVSFPVSSSGIFPLGDKVPEISPFEVSPTGVCASRTSEISTSGVFPSSAICPSGACSPEISLPQVFPSGLGPSEISFSEIIPSGAGSEFSPCNVSPPIISGISSSGITLPRANVLFEISPAGVCTSPTSKINPSGDFTSDIISSSICSPGIYSSEPSLPRVFPSAIDSSEIPLPNPCFSEISQTEISPSGVSSSEISPSGIPSLEMLSCEARPSAVSSPEIYPPDVSSFDFCPSGIYPCGVSNAGTSSSEIYSCGIYESSALFPSYGSVSSDASSETVSSGYFEPPVDSAVASFRESFPFETSLPDVTDSSCGSSCDNSICDSSEVDSSLVSSTIVSAPVVEPTSIATPITSAEPVSCDPLDSEASSGCENNVCGC